MLTSYATPERSASPNFLEGQVAFSHPRLSNNRSVMPLDVRGCTRATLTGSACAYPTPAGAGNPLNPIRDGDRGLQTRSEEHTSELQSLTNLVCRLLLEKKKKKPHKQMNIKNR